MLPIRIKARRIEKEKNVQKIRGYRYLLHRDRADVRRRSSAAELSTELTATKSKKKLLRMILWVSLGILFLVGGSVACGLLWQQADTTSAILVFIAALVGCVGCVYSFYRFLREISSKPKAPFISTLH